VRTPSIGTTTRMNRWRGHDVTVVSARIDSFGDTACCVLDRPGVLEQQMPTAAARNCLMCRRQRTMFAL
ncbi:MAG TPA: hypothetical protein VI077_03665, partial [Pseudolabrys sp.]